MLRRPTPVMRMERRMNRGPLLGLLALASLAACQPLPPAEGPADPSRAKQPGDAALVQPEAAPKQAAPAEAPDDTAKLGPRLRVEGEQGQPHASAQGAFESARKQLSECTPNQRGVLNVRIRTGPTRTSMEVDPQSSVSRAASQCVLEVLSTIDVDEALNQGSPSDRPQRGGVSVVRLEW